MENKLSVLDRYRQFSFISVHVGEIMLSCLHNLLENKDEERLECLCKLLTTVGKELESRKVDISLIFNTMKDIVDKKDGSRVSSRVRFMLQDVIDLRAGGWVPRRTDLNPKMIDQIQKEADNEQLTIQVMNSTPITPRKDERNSGPNSERKRGGGRNISDDGWSTAHSRGKNIPFSVQSDKLKFKQPTIDEPFGSSQTFGNWGRGLNIKYNRSPATNTAKMFAALEKIDVEDKSMLIKRKMILIVQEYYSGCSSIEDSKLKIESSIPASAFEQLVFDVSLEIAKKTKKSRVKTGELFAHLIESGVLPLDTYCAGLEKIFSLAEDLIVDLPMIWDYFADLISVPITSVLPLDRFHKCCKFISLPGQGKDLLRTLFKHVIEDKGPNTLITIWKDSNMKFEDFMPANEVESFISNNKFEFLIGNSAKIVSICKSRKFTYPQVYDKVLEFIKQDKDKKSTPFDDVSTWIMANSGDDTKEEEFVRTLAIQSIVNKLEHPQDQWSPYNKTGKKVYDPDFLLSLPQSKPVNILNDIALDDKARQTDMNSRGYMMSGRTDFVPPFGGGGNFTGGKSQSQRGEDVKLHETENAWKPARLNTSGAPDTDDDKKTEELYKKVRGVLNRLTPQKFKTLLNQIKTLPIDTSDRLQGVVDLVFEKAVDEPNFTVACALMCRELALIQVPVSTENKEFVNFRKLLVTRCQLEFERNSTEERNRNDKLNEIEKSTDPEKKKELTASLEEDDRRKVGNIRLIGELFKQQMLTVNIMLRCLHNLLENKDEERLECLCKLLTTVGKELESRKVDISSIFNTMKDIVDKKDGSRVSSRVRFMLQDVIDLRAGGWVPRRTDLNPKTIDQIQKEADNEQLTIQVMNSTPITPRKDERNSGPNSDRKRGGGRNISDDGWSTAHSRGKNIPFSMQSDKLKFKQPTIGEPFGSSQMFGNWGRGSNIKHNPPPATNTANMFAALEKIDVENKSMSGRPGSKDPYNSKGPSLERTTFKQYEGSGSRSGSQHRSNDNSQRNSPAPPVPAVKPQAESLDPELIKRKMNLIVQEYYSGCSSIEDSKLEIESSIPASAFEQLVFDVSLEIAEKTKKSRVKTGELFAHLIESGVLPLDTYCTGLEKIFSLAEDLIVDLPMIWDCFADLISVPITSVLPLDRFHKCCKFISLPGQGKDLLRTLFKHVIEDKGPNTLITIWKDSNMKFEDFMPANEVESFISNNKFEFLIGNSAKIVSICKSRKFTYPQIYDKLLEFIKQDKDKKSTQFDDVSTWITANIGDDTKEEEFVRTLATVIIECSITSAKLDADQLRSLYPYLHKYIDSQPAFELQCLYAIQSIVNKLEHPQGLLLNLFNTLYEDNIISHDSFINWEQSDDPQGQEKKGVALKQLTSFFTQLKENDEDSGGSSGSDEPYTAD